MDANVQGDFEVALGHWRSDLPRDWGVFQNPLSTTASENQQIKVLTHLAFGVPEIAVIGTIQ
jgi:hypothetical protein